MFPEEPALSDCFNCGPTERAILAKNLCTKCYRVDKIRNRFDPKPKPGPFEWTPKRVATLRYFRIELRQRIPLIADYLGTTVSQVRKAIKKYKVIWNSKGGIKS